MSARNSPLSSEALLWMVIVFGLIPAQLSGKGFSTRIVDGLGRAIPGVVVDVHWLRKDADGEVRKAELVKLTSNDKGVAKGSFDGKTIPAGEDVWVELSKDGYSGYSTDNLRPEYVIQREFHTEDLKRITTLADSDRVRELRELLAGEFEGADLAKQVFFNERLFRPALRGLVEDGRVAKQAIGLLAFIGAPDDLRWIVQHAPSPKRKLFEDRWAYGVVSALVEPGTEKEWSFLRKCALNEYNDRWVDAGAVRSLKLIASPRCLQILQEVRSKNEGRAISAANAIQYIRSNPPPLSDQNLVDLGKRLALVIQIGNWTGNKPPGYNESGDKACIDCEFIAGRDLLVHTATFHKVGELWIFRGVRETMQALLAKSSEPGVNKKQQ